MLIERKIVGYLETNCYILDKSGRVLVIDPGDEFDKIDKVINGRSVVGIIITHHHFDHVGAIDDVVNKYKCNVYDRSNLVEGSNTIDNFTFDVLYTPGHKEDSISIYFPEDKVMFTGDFLFRDSVGRFDMPGGNRLDLISSIEKIRNYDRSVAICPGHGETSTLGYEIDNNIYFNGELDIL